MISKLYDRSKDRQIVADIVNLPLEDSTVDILNNHYLFADNREYEGGPSKKRAVEEINRVLRPGGYILQGGSGPFESWSLLPSERKYDKALEIISQEFIPIIKKNIPLVHVFQKKVR